MIWDGRKIIRQRVDGRHEHWAMKNPIVETTLEKTAQPGMGFSSISSCGCFRINNVMAVSVRLLAAIVPDVDADRGGEVLNWDPFPSEAATPPP